MADIFFGTEVEPSAFEIAMQNIFLSGLTQRVAETNDLSSAVNEVLGFKPNKKDKDKIDAFVTSDKSTADSIKSKNIDVYETGDNWILNIGAANSLGF